MSFSASVNIYSLSMLTVFGYRITLSKESKTVLADRGPKGSNDRYVSRDVLSDVAFKFS